MTYKYTAIIIEPRKHKALSFVLNNILDCLSNEWKIILYHGINNIEFCNDITNILNLSYRNRIKLVNLNIDNLNQKTYSKLLATESIIYDHIDTEYFLVFQTDSMMFKNNSHLLDLFLDKDYDYVGPPWLISDFEPTRRRDFIGNGGFSLRKTKTMLKIIETYQWEEDMEFQEDLFFTNKYENIIINKPSYELAKMFCVDEVFSPVTMACHNNWRHYHFDDFIKIYPEAIILKELQKEY